MPATPFPPSISTTANAYALLSSVTSLRSVVAGLTGPLSPASPVSTVSPTFRKISAASAVSSSPRLSLKSDDSIVSTWKLPSGLLSTVTPIFSPWVADSEPREIWALRSVLIDTVVDCVASPKVRSSMPSTLKVYSPSSSRLGSIGIVAVRESPNRVSRELT